MNARLLARQLVPVVLFLAVVTLLVVVFSQTHWDLASASHFTVSSTWSSADPDSHTTPNRSTQPFYCRGSTPVCFPAVRGTEGTLGTG